MDLLHRVKISHGGGRSRFHYTKNKKLCKDEAWRMQESSLIGRDVYSLKKIGSFGSGIMT